MCDTTLLFPGGVVRVSNDHVWSSLARWTSASDRRTVHLRCTSGEWLAELRDEKHSHFGRSRQSMADGVAFALQLATNTAEES